MLQLDQARRHSAAALEGVIASKHDSKLSPSRMAFLDGLRGLAALNVVMSHFVVAFDFAIYTGRPEHAHSSWEVPVSTLPFLFVGPGANFSVCIFLALSGLVLARSFHRTSLNPVQLVVKRAIRLGLPVVAASLLGWAVLESGLAFNRQAAEFTRSTWLMMQFGQVAGFGDALLQAWYSLLGTPTLLTSYNSVLWTMPIEFVGSLILTAVVATQLPARRPRLAGALFVVLGGVFCRTFLSIIMFGAALYLLDVARLSVHARWRPVLLVLLCLLGTVPFSEARGPFWSALLAITSCVPAVQLALPGFNLQGDVSLWHGFAAVGLVALVIGWPAMQGVLARPSARWLGQLSFPLYLVHIPALFSVACLVFLAAPVRALPYPQAVLLAFIAYMPAVFGLALLMDHLVDRPAIRLASKLGTRR